MPGVLTLVPLLVLWEIVGRLDLVFVLPPLSEVLAAAWQLIVSGDIAKHAGGTIVSLLIGLGISIVAGVGLGVLMARYRIVDEVLGIYVDVLMSAPVSAIVPVLVLLFGTGGESIIAAVVLFCFFVITINTYSGVKEVDGQLIEMARSFSVPEHLVLRRVIVPGALPLMLTGLRMGIGRSVNGAIFGEMLVSVVGLGGPAHPVRQPIPVRPAGCAHHPHCRYGRPAHDLFRVGGAPPPFWPIRHPGRAAVLMSALHPGAFPQHLHETVFYQQHNDEPERLRRNA